MGGGAHVAEEHLAALQQLLLAARLWSSGAPVDLGAIAAQRDAVLRANHRRYCAQIPIYRALAEERGIGVDADLTQISAELVLNAEVFKSYDAGWTTGDLRPLTRWLGTVSTLRTDDLPTTATDLDAWRTEMKGHGLAVTFSSGTTGVPSLVPRDHLTLAALRASSGVLLPWALAPGSYDVLLFTVPGMGVGIQSGAAGLAAGAVAVHWVDPRTDDLSTDAAHLDGALAHLRSGAAAGRPALLYGPPAAVDRLAAHLRTRGATALLHPQSAVVTGGGWKGAAPQDLATLFATLSAHLGLDPMRCVDTFSAAELNTVFVTCAHGRYHVPPVITALVLDDLMQPLGTGVTGRLATLDPFAQSYPGFLATGDVVTLADGPCDCGLAGDDNAAASDRTGGGCARTRVRRRRRRLVTTGPTGSDLVDARTVGGIHVVLLPSIVRGAVRRPASPGVGQVREAVAARSQIVIGPTDDGTILLGRPIIDRETLEPTGETQVLVLAAPDPRELPEPDPAAAIDALLALPHREVCAFVDAVGEALRSATAGTADASGLLAATSQLGDRAHRAFASQLPELFDGAAVRRMVEGDLGLDGLAALDGWVDVPQPPIAGIGARMAEQSEELAPQGHARGEPLAVTRPQLHAVPTRQLHLTAGNAPVVPVASLLWAWGTKGAAVVKPAAEAAAVVAAIGAALAAVDPTHPLTRHTTLAYWRGGDPNVESVLLADGAFDRRVAWGSSETIESVTRRGGSTDTIILRPRQALSLIAQEAVRDDLPQTVRLAAVDSLVANQQACMSSLLHVVAGTAEDVDRYARALAEVMAAWDRALPHRPSPDVQARLVALRRGRLATARWHVNGTWPQLTSAVVVLAGGGFDLSEHPGGRLVLVRGVADLGDALPLLGPAVANVGVTPDSARHALRDRIAARGVDNVLPLGAAEQGYAGRPHDGMRVLGRLVRWVNG